MQIAQHPAHVGSSVVRPCERLRTLPLDECQHLTTLLVEPRLNDSRRTGESLAFEVPEQPEHGRAPRSRRPDDDVTASSDDRRPATRQLALGLTFHGMKVGARLGSVKSG
ncbi:MAG TPA: hypothetical protein VFX65_02905 [Candidatus Limnocylindrales bacterium]|nr:hypothetical protein [Candidatus Limnocylindrales bacterium]